VYHRGRRLDHRSKVRVLQRDLRDQPRRIPGRVRQQNDPLLRRPPPQHGIGQIEPHPIDRPARDALEASLQRELVLDLDLFLDFVAATVRER
jgi:hypothetical protein